jgi:hypothetical protein
MENDQIAIAVAQEPTVAGTLSVIVSGDQRRSTAIRH